MARIAYNAILIEYIVKKYWNLQKLNESEVAGLKKLSRVIIGVILMVALGLVLNVLFADRASRGTSDQRDYENSSQEVTQDRQDDAEVLEVDQDANDQPDADESDDSSEDQELAQQQDQTNQNQEEPVAEDSNIQTDQGQPAGNGENAQGEPSQEETGLTQDNTDDSSQSSQDNQSDNGQASQSEESEQKTDENPEEEEPTQEPVSITIDSRQNGGSYYSGEIRYEQGDTALDILLRFTQNRGLSVTLVDEYGSGEIYEIGGHEMGEGRGQWELYINGQRSLYPAGANKITPGASLRYQFQAEN